MADHEGIDLKKLGWISDILRRADVPHAEALDVLTYVQELMHRAHKAEKQAENARHSGHWG